MAAVDPFMTYTSLANILAPISRTFIIDDGVTDARSDTAELAIVTRAIYVGTSGTVKVVTAGGDTVVLPNLAAGVWHPLRVKQVYATGTANNLHIIGGY